MSAPDPREPQRLADIRVRPPKRLVIESKAAGACKVLAIVTGNIEGIATPTDNVTDEDAKYVGEPDSPTV